MYPNHIFTLPIKEHCVPTMLSAITNSVWASKNIKVYKGIFLLSYSNANDVHGFIQLYTISKDPTVILCKPVMNACTMTCKNCTQLVIQDNMNPTVNHYQYWFD